MITYEEHRLRSLVDEGRWIELLGAYRQARAAAVALDLADGGLAGGSLADGDLADGGLADGHRAVAVAAAQSRAGIATAALGHLIAYAAPPEVAARLFDADGGPGTAAGVADHDAGPLWEVLATRHTWRRLAPLLGPTPVRLLVAQTRVLLGEDLSRGAEPDPEGCRCCWSPGSRSDGPRACRSGSTCARAVRAAPC